MTDKVIKTTDREVGHFIEELSRIMRNVKLIKQGKIPKGMVIIFKDKN